MDEPRNIPSISAAEAEAFARGVLSAEHPENLHLATIPGRRYVAGEVPPALRAFLDGECGSLTGYPFDATGTTEPLRIVMSAPEVAEMQSFSDLDRKRDALLARLLFSARNLAQDDIVSFGEPRSSMCLKCWAVEEGGKLAHQPSCLAGQTLIIIADLVKNCSQLAAFGADGGVA